ARRWQPAIPFGWPPSDGGVVLAANATKLVAVNDEGSPLMITVYVPGATSRVVFDTQTVIMS
ncbi:MAG: hypothetical protein WCC65_09175, partial [Pseudonocardiaceae bacterium]